MSYKGLIRFNSNLASREQLFGIGSHQRRGLNGSLIVGRIPRMASLGAIENEKYNRASAALSVCRIDCCTFLVEIDGCLTLFDPWINDPAKFAPFWGSYHKEPIVVKDLPQPDVLFISQNAPDHCDLQAISALSKATNIVAPRDAAPRLRNLGFAVEVIDAGQWKNIRSLKITAIPSEHPGVLKQNGYFLESESVKVLVLADPAMTPSLVAAVDALPKPIDAVLLASTGFTLRYFGQIAMRPEEAAQLVARTRARHVFPTRTLMREGVSGLLGRVLVKSFVTPEDSFRRFSEELARVAPAIEIHKLARGEGWTLT